MTLSNSGTSTEIKKTGDGSDTLISEKFNQPYHSLNGAVAESRHVYFEANRLATALSDNQNLTILEIGFGTGMNLILLLDYLKKKKSRSAVTFCSVEAYPIDSETAASVSFGDDIEFKGYESLLEEIFSDLNPGWNRFEVTGNVTLNLFIGKFLDMTFAKQSDRTTQRTASQNQNPASLSLPSPIDFVLHDPFSPDSNPDGWTPELFKTIFDQSYGDAMLTTYSAATSARAAMAVAGWNIARAPGALGKREMTVASKNPEKLSHLKRVNEERLIQRYQEGDFE